MIAINIDNPVIEEFYKNECKSNQKEFINKLLDYIENYQIKKSFEKGLKEVMLIKQEKLPKRDLKSVLDEL